MILKNSSSKENNIFQNLKKEIVFVIGNLSEKNTQLFQILEKKLKEKYFEFINFLRDLTRNSNFEKILLNKLDDFDSYYFNKFKIQYYHDKRYFFERNFVFYCVEKIIEIFSENEKKEKKFSSIINFLVEQIDQLTKQTEESLEKIISSLSPVSGIENLNESSFVEKKIPLEKFSNFFEKIGFFFFFCEYLIFLDFYF